MKPLARNARKKAKVPVQSYYEEEFEDDVTYRTRADYENKLIPVKMEEVRSDVVRPCHLCNRNPSTQEVESGFCATCGLELEKIRKFKCTINRAAIMGSVFAISLVVLCAITLLAYYGATKKSRTLKTNWPGVPLESTNITTMKSTAKSIEFRCKIHKIGPWSMWDKTACNSGLQRSNRTLSGKGNYCLPSVQYQLCDSSKNGCPPGWHWSIATPYNCYYLSDETLEFSVAKEKCKSKQADLIIIDDDLEWSVIKQMINETWIDVQVPEEEKTSTNKTTPNDDDKVPQYVHWAAGYPKIDLKYNKGMKFCVHMKNGFWLTDNCKRGRRFVCKKNYTTPMFPLLIATA